MRSRSCYAKAITSVAMGLTIVGATTHATGAQPNDANANVPKLEYRSAFANYQGFRDAKAENWKALNDEVERVGGHLGILRAKPQPPSTPPAHAEHAAKPR